jgi:hypothetical protein
MLYREIIAVCSESHAKHINALGGQNVEFVNVKLVVQIVTTGRKMLTNDCICGMKSGFLFNSFIHTLNFADKFYTFYSI